MKNKIKILYVIVFAFISYNCSEAQLDSNYFKNHYSTIADKIINEAMKDSSSWEKLAYFCEAFGPRLCGSKNLENALQWAYSEMKKEGLYNVQLEDVMVPHWVRGNEFCKMTSPWERNMPFLSLGGSIATPKEGIKAPVLVVKSYEDLYNNKEKAKGKIVVFNIPFIHYGQAVQYRVHGNDSASKYGAVACLIRSVTPSVMQNPHTGVMYYNDSVPRIPHGAISPEDAQMLQRMYDWGLNPQLHLYMEAQMMPDAQSHNLMCEIKGREKPEVIIAFGGHSDSWDAGTGAHDDGSGCIAAWEAIKLLKKLGLTPRRTIRAVMWVNEENGLRGGTAYADKHKNEEHSLVFEWDCGVFPPSEIRYTGPDSLLNIVKSFEPLLNKIDSIKVIKGGGGVDISPMMRLGVNAMSLNTRDDGKYFWYHHSDTDTMDKVDPKDLNKCIATIALAIYLYADLP